MYAVMPYTLGSRGFRFLIQTLRDLKPLGSLGGLLLKRNHHEHRVVVVL